MIDTLREEHRKMSRLLDALEHQIAVFERAGKPDYDVIRGIADYFLEYPDSCHHRKEDVIFEFLCERYPPTRATVEELLPSLVRRMSASGGSCNDPSAIIAIVKSTIWSRLPVCLGSGLIKV